jgi:uncharacterized membrane protein YbhN (UPF0104 family)
LKISAVARRRLTVLFAVAMFLVALFLVNRVLGSYHWREVFDRLRAIPLPIIWQALALMVSSYAVLSCYDFLGVRYAGVSVHWTKIIMASFSAYAVSHNVGLATLSGGSVRYRIYSRAGLTAMQIVQIILFCTTTFALGAALLLGLSLYVQADWAGAMLHLVPWMVRSVGLLLLAGVAAYLLANAFIAGPLRLRGVTVRLPGLRLSALQILVASVDLCLAAAVLYVLLPAGSTDGFTAFLGVYLLAVAAGLVSNVPGGLGVFEAVLLLLLPRGAVDEKLAAILAFRAIYYMLPFLLALAVVAAHELWLHRSVLRGLLAWMRGGVKKP